jgi:hypothetical protein
MDVGEMTLTSKGGYDVYFAQLSFSRLNWDFATSFGSSSDDHVYDIGLDDHGKPILIGYYHGNVDIDQDNSNDLLLHGTYDFFLTEFDSSGNLLFADGYGTAGGESSGKGVAVDTASNIYSIGHFGSIQSGYQLNIDGTTISTHRYGDPFITKFDDSGSSIWAQAFGNSRDRSSEYANDITVDSTSQQVYLAGNWHYYSDNYWPELGIYGQGTAENGEAFVAAYDSSGAKLWARNIGAPGQSGGGYGVTEWAYDVAVDNNGLYVTGVFRSPTIWIDGTTDTLTNLDTSDYNDSFIVSYDVNGIYRWSRRIGGSDHDNIGDVILDGLGNVYVAGSFRDTVNIGSMSFTSNGDYDAFIAKYDSNGNLIWAKSFGDSLSDQIISLEVDSENNLYIGGNFQGNLDIDGDSINELTSNGDGDAFIAKYDRGGNLLGSTSFGGGGLDTVNGIVVDSTGSAYVTGHFQYTMDVGGTILTSKGGDDVYLAKLSNLFIETSGPSDDPLANEDNTFENANLINLPVPLKVISIIRMKEIFIYLP